MVELEIWNGTINDPKKSNYIPNANNLATLVIDKPFNFDSFVQPVCVDLSGVYNQPSRMEMQTGYVSKQKNINKLFY